MHKQWLTSQQFTETYGKEVFDLAQKMAEAAGFVWNTMNIWDQLDFIGIADEQLKPPQIQDSQVRQNDDSGVLQRLDGSKGS